MSRKRHSTAKSKSRKRASYAQKHPRARANSVRPSPQEVENERYKIIFVIMLIIAIIALLFYLIQGGAPAYDWYPGQALYDR